MTTEISKNNAMKYAINLLANKIFSDNDKIGIYTICDICGVGSNGFVFTVVDSNNNKYAMKILNASYYLIDYFNLDSKNFHESTYDNINIIEKTINSSKFIFRDHNKSILKDFKYISEEKSFKREFLSLKSLPKNDFCVYMKDFGFFEINSTNNNLEGIYKIPYIVMPIFKGITLTDYIESNNYKCDYKKIFIIIKKITNIIRFIHKYNIIHRDLFTNNFLYDEFTDNVVLLDFGSALYNNDTNNDTEGERRGARRFMSPEQFKDPGKVKYYSDYYFIGSVLFYMLTKHTPFSRDRNGTTHAKKIQSYLNKTDFSNKNIYENIVSLVNKLLEYNINDRLINLDEIEDYIDKIISLL